MKKIIIVIIIVIVAICILLVAGYKYIDNGRGKKMKPNTKDSFYGTFLFVNECTTNLKKEERDEEKSRESVIAAALASAAVKTGIDWIGAALQRAAQDDVDTTTVSSNLISISQIATAEKNLCLQVVRGEFKCSEDNTNSYTNSYSIDSKSLIVAPLQVVEGTEELFVEILPIIHDTVVSFIPLQVRYSGFTPSDNRIRGPRDLALFVGYALPAKDVSAGDYSGRLINFGTLVPDNDKQAIINYVTDDCRLSLVNQTQWLSLPANDKDQPITFAASVIETRKANQFSKFLADVFALSKEDIKNAASAAVTELEFFKTSEELRDIEIARLKNELKYYDVIEIAQRKKEALTKLKKNLCASGKSEESEIS
ncbi:MAG: hypothetical protein ACK2TV_10850, partial [Anaerolineales bacterium]